MPTSTARPSSHIPALDGLRGLAVLLVFFFHYGGGGSSANPAIRALAGLNKIGWSGVTLFFVLSGFLITSILWRSFDDPHWRRNFYARRALRILPLYFVALALILIMGAFEHRLALSLKTFAVFFFFLQNIPGVPAMFAPLPIYHLWSLAVEQQFYLLWPLLLACARSRRQAAWLCIAVFTLSLLFRILLWRILPNPEIYNTFLLTHAGELALGGLLAILSASPHWFTVCRIAPTVFVVSSTALLASACQQGTFDLLTPLALTTTLTAVSFVCAALLVLALTPGLFQHLVSVRWLRWLGTISYGIYVYHLLLRLVFNALATRVVHEKSGMKFLAARMLIAAIGTIAVSWASFRFYEQPLLKLKKYFPSATPASGNEFI